MSNKLHESQVLVEKQKWVVVQHEAGKKSVVMTEVLQLPHGCLVRSTVMRRHWLCPQMATAAVFVPNLKLERTEGEWELKHGA